MHLENSFNHFFMFSNSFLHGNALFWDAGLFVNDDN